MKPVWTWALALLLGCDGSGSPAAGVAVRGGPPPVKACPAGDELSSDQVVAKWDGGELRVEEVQRRVAKDLRNLEIQHRLERFERQSRALDQLVVEALLEREAERLGHPNVETLLQREVEDKVPDPTDEEVTDLYPVMSRKLGGAPLEQAKPYLRQELTRRAQSEHYARWLAELKERADVRTSLPYPDLPRVDVAVTADDPVRGQSEAPITIVQFAEFQCAYCGVVSNTLERLLEAYPERVRLVFKDFPLAGHTRSMPAAIAAHCAGEQDRFWDMHDRLLANQHALSDSDLVGHGQSLGLDMDAYESCMQSRAHEEAVHRDLQVGRRAGVTATPTFFINGIYLSGAQSYERFAAIVDNEIERLALDAEEAER